MSRPTYRPFVVERHVAASRDVVWTSLLELLDRGLVRDAAVGDERVLSFEPPWRRVGRLESPPIALVEHTVALREDGDETHIVWALICEAPTTDEAEAAAEPVLERLRRAVTAWADTLASAATAVSAIEGRSADG
jgi:hypothetical protein